MKTNPQSTALIIDGTVIPVRIDPVHEYTLTTKEVATGYGVGESNIKETKRAHGDELIEGKHFLEVRNPDFQPGKGGAHKFIYWTKRGIVRLGFFIRSERAKRFRDMAEDLVIRAVEENPVEDYTGLSTVEIIARKIATFEIGRNGTVHDFGQLMALHQRFSGPSPRETALVEGISGCLREIFRDTSEIRADVEHLRRLTDAIQPEMPCRIEGDPFVAFLGSAFARFGSQPFTTTDLIRLGAPVNYEAASPARSLGHRLSLYLERRIRTPETPVPVTLHRRREARSRSYYFVPDRGQ